MQVYNYGYIIFKRKSQRSYLSLNNSPFSYQGIGRCGEINTTSSPRADEIESLHGCCT